ncbi:hypothetical protein [Streptomyces kronopolitis]|uniref:hypothetical protein n=1 Tax=Streptomyces kronopolitis TaxID=1612435 RepID=UPI003444360E
MTERQEDAWRAQFAARVVDIEGGHLRWTGTAGHRGTPLLALNSRVETAYRLSFRWHYGREPEGNVRPACVYPACVAGAHLKDRVLRASGGAA